MDSGRDVHDLLDRAAPTFDAIEVGSLQGRRRRRRSGRLAIGGAVAVVAAMATTVAITRDGGTAARQQQLAHPPSPTSEYALHAPCENRQLLRQQASAAQISKFGAVAAVRCLSTERRYAGQGEWQVTLRQVATVGVARFVTGLMRPDDSTAPQGGECLSIAYGLPPLFLVDVQGRYLHPRFPHDYCGAPLDTGYKDLRWRTVAVDKVKQTRSQASIASGCEMGWKNENALYARLGATHTGAGGPVFTLRPRALLKACVYRGDAEGGDFVRVVELDAAQSTQLRGALAGPGPTHSCPAQRSFAVISAGGQFVNVELGGCWRVQRDDLNPSRTGTAQASVLVKLLRL